jgi:putative ABC transport system ATP-binding protein
MIEIQELSRTFQAPDGGVVKALDGISLTVGQGEFVSVVGASGSGKSTLLYAIGGLSAPTGGRVVLDGRDVFDLGQNERAALRRTEIGFVFQTFNLVPYLSILENVMLPALLAKRGWGASEAAATRLLARLGLAARAGHRPGQLSVGERQRAGIARSLVNTPRVILADEPTGNLDPDAANEVMALFDGLNEAGQTIVMVTHDLRLAERARRVVRLRAGAVAEDRPSHGERLAS